MTAIVASPSTRPKQAQPRVRSWLSPWRLLAIGTFAVLVVLTVRPVIEPDVFWHIRLGNQIIATHSVHGAGSDFAFTLPGHKWVTTQWLSEVMLATVYNLGGWAGIIVMRVLLSVGLLAALSWQLLRGRRTAWAPLVFAPTAFMAYAYFQERPQFFSMFFVVWLAGVLRDEIVGLRRHHLPAIMVVTWLWANIHGAWILVPACYTLLALARLIDRSPTSAGSVYRGALRPASTAGAALACACFTPVGPRLLLSPMSFAGATTQIVEWQPTNFHSLLAVLFALVIGAAIFSWARTRHAVPLSEIVYIAGVTGFAMYAFRDVPPAAILVAPIVLRRLELSFHRADQICDESERRFVFVAAAILVLVGLSATVVKSLHTSTLLPTAPRLLVEQVAAEPGQHRVLDDYRASGVVILWGGPRTQVAIDGRADRYGARFISDYSKLMLTMGDWQQQLAALDPNYAVLSADVPLVRELVTEGWTVRDTEGPWVLLERPVTQS